jgi:hypothetical protein
MTRKPNKNPAASIRARLLSLPKKGEDYERVLGRFAIERFLYRLGISPFEVARKLACTSEEAREQCDSSL